MSMVGLRSHELFLTERAIICRMLPKPVEAPLQAVWARFDRHRMVLEVKA
jgi:hypothetical protein